METESMHYPEERRGRELRHDRSGNARLSDGNLASAGDRLCDRWPATTPFPTALFHLSTVVSNSGREVSARLVWFDSRRRWPAVPDPRRRNDQAERPAQ